MDKIILINNEALCFLKAVDSVEKAILWADILVPTCDYMVTDVQSTKTFSIYTDYELRKLFFNTVGQHPPVNTKYSTLLKGVLDLASKLRLDETPLEDLKDRLAIPATVEVPVDVDHINETLNQHEADEPQDSHEIEEAKAAKKEKPKTKKKAAKKTLGKPKEGTATATVWIIADELNKVDPGLGIDSKEFRKCVVDQCVEKGVNKSTASTQFGKWKKHLQTMT